MKKRKVLKFSTLLLGCGFVSFAFMSYARIARLDLVVNPRCKECFSPAKTHAGCLIAKDKKILLVRDSWSKKLGFPAGHHDFGERAFQTAYRETLEETGIRVVIDEYLYESKATNFRLFKCNIIEETGKHDGEILEFAYVGKEDIRRIIDEGDARFADQLEFVYQNFETLSRSMSVL